MGKNVLVVGHAFIVEANRLVWSRLNEKGYEVDLIAPSSWSSNLVGEVQLKKSKVESINSIHSLNTFNKGNGSFYFYNPIQLYKVLKKKKYDEIIINQEGWSLSLFFFNLVNILTTNRKTNIYLMVAQNIKKSNLKWAIPLERFNLLFVNRVLGCCAETEDVMRWKNIKTPWSYFPLYYGEGLETIGLTQSKKIRLGYIGRISEEKGIHSLIEAFKSLQKEFDIELIIAGKGPMENEIAIDGVKFLGVLPHNQVNQFYSQIDVLILPSLTRGFWKEQFGRVIVESIASGRIVIGSNSGAIPEVLGHIGLDYIFDEGSSKSIVDEVKRYISEKDKIDIKKYQEKNKKLFSIDAFVDRTIRIFNGENL